MKKLRRASDYSTGMMYEIEGEKEAWPAKRLAEYLGRCESGEIVWIWDDANDSREPDHAFYWDANRRKYCAYRPV